MTCFKFLFHWAFLFLLVPVLGVGTFILGPMINHWLPPDVSAHGSHIDNLFYFILWLTGIVFVATTGLLCYFVWRYDAKRNPDPVKFSHGNHNLEIIWTIIPAASLLFIAIYQINVWADMTIRQPEPELEVAVTGRQFEWRLQYPGPDGKLGNDDDVFIVNDMHIPCNRRILVRLKSMDVLHSFFLPHLRVKQDAVPGMDIPVWFTATREGTFDIVCAELCGWGHYKMKGRLTIESQEDFDAWHARAYEEQEAVQ